MPERVGGCEVCVCVDPPSAFPRPPPAVPHPFSHFPSFPTPPPRAESPLFPRCPPRIPPPHPWEPTRPSRGGVRGGQAAAPRPGPRFLGWSRPRFLRRDTVSRAGGQGGGGTRGQRHPGDTRPWSRPRCHSPRPTPPIEGGPCLSFPPWGPAGGGARRGVSLLGGGRLRASSPLVSLPPQPPTPPHSFREKTLRRGGACAACGETLGPQGLVCRGDPPRDPPETSPGNPPTRGPPPRLPWEPPHPETPLGPTSPETPSPKPTPGHPPPETYPGTPPCADGGGG